MPVQTSVITGTVAHKHSATGGSSDGGKLAVGGLGGDTSFDLAASSMLYSNGTSLEELAIGGAGESLTVSGGVPAWAAAGGGAIELISDVQVTSDTPTVSHTWSGVSFDDYSMVRVIFNGWLGSSADMYITLQNPALTGTSYNQQRFEVKGGTAAGSQITEARIRQPNGNGQNWGGTIDIFADDSDNTHSDQRLKWMLNTWGFGSQNALQLDMGYYDGATSVTESTGIHYATAGAVQFKDGFYSAAYKYSRT